MSYEYVYSMCSGPACIGAGERVSGTMAVYILSSAKSRAISISTSTSVVLGLNDSLQDLTRWMRMEVLSD
jgi:hypothetical protein